MLSVVDVTVDRPDRPRFQRLASRLTSSLVAIAGRRWQVEVRSSDVPDPDVLLAATARADAVVLMGGEDVAPEFYHGAAPYPGEGPHHEDSDRAQIRLVHRNVELGIPTLGICRGIQVINVALGGSLVQDLAVPGHRNPHILDDLTLRTHPVRVDPRSHLGGLLADRGEPVIDVQSAHHQAVDRPGEGLEVVGASPRGVVEAVQHRTAPLLGVQWHPEDPNVAPTQANRLLAGLERLAAGRG